MKRALLYGIRKLKRNILDSKTKQNLAERINLNTISHHRLKRKARNGFTETERYAVWKAIIKSNTRKSKDKEKQHQNGFSTVEIKNSQQETSLTNHRLAVTFKAALCLYIKEKEVKELIDDVLSTSTNNKNYFPLKSIEDQTIEYVFNDLIEDYAPSLSAHVRNIQETEENYQPNWKLFLFDLFSEIYPQSCFCKLFDAYLVEGYKIIYRYTLAHLFLLKTALLDTKTGKEFDSVLKQKQDEQAYSETTNKAFEIKITRRRIEHHKKVYSGMLLEEGISMPLESNLIGARTVSEREMETIRGWIPYRLKLCAFDRVFSTITNGHSMRTFYSTCEKYTNLLLVIKTIEKNIFGVFLSQPLSKRKKGSFFGTGEMFLFSLVPAAEKYAWCQDLGLMSFIFADNKSICIGGGSGSFGLWIGCCLEKCQSSYSSVFRNPPFTKGISKIEVLEAFHFRT